MADFPVTPNAASWHLLSNSQSFTSPFTNTSQITARDGDKWVVTLGFTNLTQDKALLIQGFAASLRGASGSFELYDHRFPVPTGTGAGAPRVNGASQTGRSLVTDGWSASETVLKAGDKFQVGTELKIVTQDAITNGSGQVTLNFAPELRVSPSDNALIVVNQPKGVFRMTDDSQGAQSTTPGTFTNLTVTCEEVIL